MCNLCNKTTCLLAGIAIGVMIGYQNENEIDDLTRQAKRAKRKMMRKMYDVKDQFDM